MIDIRYASRKFILAAFLLLAALGLLVAGLIDQATWERFSTWVLGLYITGNLSAAYVSARAAAAPAVDSGLQTIASRLQPPPRSP